LNAALLDAEVHERGYQLSGDPAQREACRAAVPRAQDAARQLRMLTADEAGQQRRLDALEPVLDRRLALLRGTLALAAGPLETAVERPVNGESKRALDELRTLLTAVRDDALSMLAQQSARSEALGWWLGLATGLASALTLGGAAAALLLSNRAAARRL